MPSQYSNFAQTRDSLELASLASSSGAGRGGPDTASDDGVVSSRPSLSSSRKLSFDNEDPLDSANPAAAGAGISGGRGRAFSVSSAFDFAPNLFPLSSTAGGAGYAPLGGQPISSSAAAHGGGGGRGGGLLGAAGALERNKTLTYVNGLGLIVGLIIGSGVFSSPSQVSANVGSPGASLVVWVIAGVLAWTGAASYAELGGAIPLNGGPQVYLAKILGEMAGFLFTWVAVLVLKPGSAAIISIIMGEYLVRAVAGADAVDISPWVNKAVALGGLVVVTLFNCASTRLGTKVNDTLMFFKFVALLGVTATGIVVAATGFSFNGEANTEWRDKDWFEGTSGDMSAWAVALYAGLWAYDGWDNTNYVVGEFRNPSRDLPRVIHSAMPLVILFYVLANVAYFLVLPLSVVNGSNTVAVMFGSKVFGPVGSLVFALIVSASCFGALNSTTFTSSRLVYAAGKEGYVPSVFGNLGLRSPFSSSGDNDVATSSSATHLSWHNLGGGGGRGGSGRLGSLFRRLFADPEVGLFHTPILALLLNAVITSAYIAVGEFGTLVTFYGVAGYSFYFLTVLGLIILRVKEPGLERPYRTWITTPIIFCCVSLFLLSRAVFAQPLQTLTVVLFVVAGVPVYFWRIRGRDEVSMRGGLDGEGRRRGPWWRFWKR